MTYTLLNGTTHYDTLEEMKDELEVLDALEPIGSVRLTKGEALLATTGLDWTGPIKLTASSHSMMVRLGPVVFVADRWQFRGATVMHSDDIVRVTVKLTNGVMLWVALDLDTEDAS